MEMMISAQTAVGALLAGGGLVSSAMQLASIRRLLEEGKLRVTVDVRTGWDDDLCNCAVPDHGHDNCAIFVWIGGCWRLDKDYSAPGFRPVHPPVEGSYENQVVTTPSAPQSE